jgi:hypothetical protein
MLLVVMLLVVMFLIRIVIFLVKGRIVALTVDANQTSTNVGLGDIIVCGALTVDADFGVTLLLCLLRHQPRRWAGKSLDFVILDLVWHQPGWWAVEGFDLVVFDLVLTVYWLSKAVEEWCIEGVHHWLPEIVSIVWLLVHGLLASEHHWILIHFL